MRIANLINKLISILTLISIVCAAFITIPRIFGIMPCIVLSGSMEPAVHTGAVAFIDTNNTNVTVGDVITYQLTDRKLITHRVVRQLENGDLITKGDANETEDNASVTSGQVVGIYLFQIPKAGYLFAALDKKHILLLVFWVAFLNGASYCICKAAEKNIDIDHGDPNP